jgi:signal transduction histidine kinase
MTHCALEKSAMIEFEPTRDPIEASISPIELEQVVVNVLRNAIESRTLGARVQVATGLRGDSILISVRDDGCGISRDALPRVFEAFFTTRSDAGGIGLGMAVAHQIISQHHGSIDLESQPGMGTNVTIALPCIGSAAARD